MINISTLERLKMELKNLNGFEERELMIYLQENELDPSANYIKSAMQKNLLKTVLQILNILANDTNLMRKLNTEFGDLGEAYLNLEKRIAAIREQIEDLTLQEQKENITCGFVGIYRS